MDRRARPKKAKRPRARKPPKGDSAKVRDLEKRLAEALKLKVEALEREREIGQALTEVLKQQTATSEILRVLISSFLLRLIVWDLSFQASVDGRRLDMMGGRAMEIRGQIHVLKSDMGKEEKGWAYLV